MLKSLLFCVILLLATIVADFLSFAIISGVYWDFIGAVQRTVGIEFDNSGGNKLSANFETGNNRIFNIDFHTDNNN